MKPGDLVWVQWFIQPPTDLVIVFDHYAEGIDIYKLVASCTRFLASSSGISPIWEDVAAWKRIDRVDLPLYIHWMFKERLFDELLRGAV
jgi:hypothetical protein